MTMNLSKKSFINGGGYQWYNKNDPDGGGQMAVSDQPNASAAITKKRIMGAVALGVVVIVSIAVGVSVSGNGGSEDRKSTDPALTLPTTPPTRAPTSLTTPTVMPVPTKMPTNAPSKLPTNAPSKLPTTAIPTISPVACTLDMDRHLEVEAHNAGGIDQFTELEICEGGKITASIGIYTGLTSLRVGQSTGSLPSEIGLLTNLEELHISCNTRYQKEEREGKGEYVPYECEKAGLGKAKGTLPSNWSNLRALKILHITSQGALTGSLPSEWSSMTSLKHFSVSNNRLINGPLPSTWGTMSSLETVNIQACKLTGSLPSEWSGMVALKNVVVQGNNDMFGILPASWGNLQALTNLDMSPYLCTINYDIRDSFGGEDCWYDINRGDEVSNGDLGGFFNETKGYFVYAELHAEWGNMQSLEHLNLRGMKYLDNKKGVEYYGNPENVPKEWAKLTNLKTADLRGTRVGFVGNFVTREFGDLLYPYGNLKTFGFEKSIYPNYPTEEWRISCGEGLDEWLRYFFYRTVLHNTTSAFGEGGNLDFYWRDTGSFPLTIDVREMVNRGKQQSLRAQPDEDTKDLSDEDAITNTEPVQAESNVARKVYSVTEGQVNLLKSISCWSSSGGPWNDKKHYHSTTERGDVGKPEPWLGPYYGTGRTIPTELALFPKLQTIDFFWQDLTGTLPTELGLLTDLKRMSFGGIGLEKTIPTQWASLTKLTELFLVQTEIDDTALPDWLNQRVASGDLDFEMLE